MDESYPRKLEVWPAPALAVLDDVALNAHVRASQNGPRTPGQFAERLYVSETLSAAQRPAGASEPYSLQWFLEIESQRHGRRGSWIPRLLEFAKHSGETLLGLGNGLGTDWLQYARHGARVVVCSPTPDYLALVRRNFELRGLAGRFLHVTPAALPLDSASIDVVCLSSLLHETADPRAVVEEVYRVLKPGGKVLAVTPGRYDVDFWHHLFFPWRRWLGLVPPPDLSGVRFSGRRLRKLFSRFVEHRVYKRQLRRYEVPHLWRCVPLPMLERLAGRLLILKAFKPLSAAM